MKICRSMIWMKVSGFLLMFLWILTLSRGDTEVSCVFLERCILPCSFQVAPQVVIHWAHVKGLNVHFYYDNQDQLVYQHQIYRNRTSLFKDQISRGNASMQLTGVKVQDEGRYECFIRTNNGESDWHQMIQYIDLKVDAPVHEVNIQPVENRITCSSEGIYPEPELTWSTTPPSNISLHNTTTVQQNEEQLYSISSSLILSHSDTDLLYSCTVKTHRNKRTATLSRTDTEVSCVFLERCILPCSFQVAPGVVIHWIHLTTALIVHMYYQNQDQLGQQHQIYRNRTSLFKDQISGGNASLQLTGVKVQDEGRYKCFSSTINTDQESVINLNIYGMRCTL